MRSSAARQTQFTSSTVVDAEVVEVVELIVRDFVGSWYGMLSSDAAFGDEVVRVLAGVVRESERRLRQVDWVRVFASDLPRALSCHVRDFTLCRSKQGTLYAGGLPLEDLFRLHQPHFALQSPAFEAEYIRHVVELLLGALLDPRDLRSDALRLLLREILTAIVISCLQRLNDPTFLNELFLGLLRPGMVKEMFDNKVQDERQRQEMEMLQSRQKLKEANKSLTVNNNNDAFRSQSIPVPAKPYNFVPAHGRSSSTQLEKDPQRNKLTRRTTTPHLSGSDLQEQRRQTSKSSTANLLSSDDNENSSSDSYVTRPRSNAAIVSKLQQKSAFSIDSSVSSPSASLATILSPDDSNTSKNNPPASVYYKLWHRLLASFQFISLTFWFYFQQALPPKLGPIDTNKYRTADLESNWITFFETLSSTCQTKSIRFRRWFWSRIIGFFRASIDLWFRVSVNRGLLRGIYWFLHEDRVAYYIRNLRLALWPNGVFDSEAPFRSRQDSERIRRELERAIRDSIPPSLYTVIDAEYVHSVTHTLVEIMQYRVLNKHLIMVVLDIILIHVLPEYVMESSSVEDTAKLAQSEQSVPLYADVSSTGDIGEDRIR